MKLFLKYLISILSILFFTYLAYLNIKLYYKPTVNTIANSTYNTDVQAQLSFLSNEFENDLGDRMQRLYPEGYFFSHVLYGLSWCELPEALQRDYREFEINFSIDALADKKGTHIFPADLQPTHGIFYAGWTNYLLAKKLYTIPYYNRDSSDIELFEKNCNEIANAFQQKNIPYLESYKGLSWPADNIVAVASLALHDKILQPKYQHFIQEWIAQIKKHLDKDGLIPHQVDFKTNNVKEQAKGSSQSLLLCFFHDIDTTFARQQFNIYKKLFVDYRFGLPGIREHKKGICDGADIDSGPVILDIGGSASIVGLKTMSIYNETNLMVGLRNSIEAFGMASSAKNSKNYLFGQVPIADCFIAWSNTNAYSSDEDKFGNWRWKFQLISLSILLFLAGLNYWLYKK